MAGLGSPTADKKIKVLPKGIACKKKTHIKQAVAFTLATFKRTIKSSDIATPTGLRGLAETFQRSKSEALNIEHLIFEGKDLVISHS